MVQLQRVHDFAASREPRFRRWIGGRVSLDVQFDLRNAIYARLQRLDFAGHDQLQTGQLVSRAGSDVALLQGILSFLPITAGNLVALVVSLVVHKAHNRIGDSE